MLDHRGVRKPGVSPADRFWYLRVPDSQSLYMSFIYNRVGKWDI
jgi:hypothetical protein